jgi:hypothetical protein
MLALVLVGCDRDPVAAPTSKPAPVLGVEISSVTPLPPSHITHLAPSRSGAIFWVQESDSERQAVFAMSDGGAPVLTPLSNTAVAQALQQPGAVGTLQSLAADNGGKLYFYFSGGKGKRLLAALGSFSPETRQITIIAQTPALQSLADMGDSLALARGTVLVAGNTLWLWLRQEDDSALLSLNLQQPGAQLQRGPAHVRAGAQEIRMTSATEDLAAGPDQALLYLDRAAGRIWRIGPVGDATQAADVSDLPPGLTAPSVDAQGRLVLFAPQPPEPDDFSLLPTTRKSNYPAIVLIDGSQRTILGRSVLTAPARFSTRALALSQLLRDRGSWVAYDTPSGEMLRLRVVQR